MYCTFYRYRGIWSNNRPPTSKFLLIGEKGIFQLLAIIKIGPHGVSLFLFSVSFGISGMYDILWQFSNVVIDFWPVHALFYLLGYTFQYLAAMCILFRIPLPMLLGISILSLFSTSKSSTDNFSLKDQWGLSILGHIFCFAWPSNEYLFSKSWYHRVIARFFFQFLCADLYKLESYI